MSPNYNETVKTVQTDKKVTLKVMNSLLCGCEFELNHETTLFIVSSPTALSDCSINTVNALMIPIKEGGINFEILIKNELLNAVEVLQHSSEGIKTKTVNFNEIIQIGSLRVIIKLAAEPWEYNIANDEIVKQTSSNKTPHKPFVALFTFIAALFFTFIYFKIYPKSKSSDFIPLAHSALHNTKALNSLNRSGTIPNLNPSYSVKEVETKLRVMKIKFTRDKISNLEIFNFTGELDDESIQKIKYIKDKNPSSNYIFSINLKDTPPSDKSFKYGSHGYIKLSANHWLLNTST